MGWSIGVQSEIEPTVTVLNALFNAGVAEYVSVSKVIEVLKGEFEENVVLREENSALQEDIDAQVQQRIANIIKTKDELADKIRKLEDENKRLSHVRMQLENLRQENEKLVYLRAERVEIRQLLEEALFVVSGYTSASPARVLRALENAIAKNGLHQDSRARRIVLDMLEEIATKGGSQKQSTRFLEIYQRELSRATSGVLAERILALVSALIPIKSPEIAEEIRQLQLRIQHGAVREAPLTLGIQSAIDDLKTQLSMLSSYDEVAAYMLIEHISDTIPRLPERELDDYPDWLINKYDVPDHLKYELSQSVSNVISCKRELTEDELALRLRRLMREFER